VEAAKKFLATVAETEPVTPGFAEVRMEAIMVPERSSCVGSTLATLVPTRHSGVQIAGITRGGRRILNPGADETLHGGDEVLLLGTPEQIDAFKAYVRGEADQARTPD
jgi:CPA2 family monovalent cation:H+ antiporter-2